MAANPQNPPRRVITSFMLRFVREAEESPVEIVIPPLPAELDQDAPDSGGRTGTTWRGVVKHIQSGAEQHFSTMAEAENFIKKYIED
jgi:hypothetical protein